MMYSATFICDISSCGADAVFHCDRCNKLICRDHAKYDDLYVFCESCYPIRWNALQKPQSCVEVFKVVQKQEEQYFSLHISEEYTLDELVFSTQKGLLGGIWCYRSLSRAKRSLTHFSKRYNVPEEDLVILKGYATWKDSQRRNGGILLVKEAVFKEVCS